MATYTSIAHNFTPPTATTTSQVGAGAMVLIKSITASSDSTISFVNGSSDVVLDGTYKTYVFESRVYKRITKANIYMCI